MQLASQFQDGSAIPRRYACDGQNQSPPLSWTAPPQQTQSFVLLCDDPDAPGGTWHHWAVYDIPAGQRSLPEHHPRHGAGVRQGLNDFHQPGYDGPCPPPGDKPHHYHFRLLALAVPRLPVTGTASCAQIAQAARQHVIATAQLTGTYQR
jgi:Raf kinase inhibitor-like YbhB/YbcL family protein